MVHVSLATIRASRPHPKKIRGFFASPALVVTVPVEGAVSTAKYTAKGIVLLHDGAMKAMDIYEAWHQRRHPDRYEAEVWYDLDPRQSVGSRFFAKPERAERFYRVEATRALEDWNDGYMTPLHLDAWRFTVSDTLRGGENTLTLMDAEEILGVTL